MSAFLPPDRCLANRQTPRPLAAYMTTTTTTTTVMPDSCRSRHHAQPSLSSPSMPLSKFAMTASSARGAHTSATNPDEYRDQPVVTLQRPTVLDSITAPPPPQQHSALSSTASLESALTCSAHPLTTAVATCAPPDLSPLQLVTSLDRDTLLNSFTLDISSKKLGDAKMSEMLRCAVHLRQLQCLWIANNNLGDGGVEAVSTYLDDVVTGRRGGGVSTTTYHSNSNDYNTAEIEPPSPSTSTSSSAATEVKLQGLSLHNNKMTGKACVTFRLFERITSLQHLQVVSLHNNPLGDIGVMALSDAVHRAFGETSVKGRCGGGDGDDTTGVSATTTTAKMMKTSHHSRIGCSWKVLYLSNVSATDESINRFACDALPCMLQLQKLFLSANSMSDVGAAALCKAICGGAGSGGASPPLKELQELDVSKNVIGGDGKKLLMSTLNILRLQC